MGEGPAVFDNELFLSRLRPAMVQRRKGTGEGETAMGNGEIIPLVEGGWAGFQRDNWVNEGFGAKNQNAMSLRMKPGYIK